MSSNDHETGVIELEAKSDEAFRVFKKLHPNLRKRGVEGAFIGLIVGIDMEQLREIGNLCLVTSDVGDEDQKYYEVLAKKGIIEASILGPGVVLGPGIEKDSAPIATRIVHSIVENTTFPTRNFKVENGSIVIDSRFADHVEISNTSTMNANFANVAGSSGGLTVTGQIRNANLAEAGDQIIVTPRAEF